METTEAGSEGVGGGVGASGGPPGGFQKGHDPRRHAPNKASAGEKKPVGEYVSPPDDGAEGVLQAMRHCNLNHKSHDRTPEQKHTREYMEKSPVAFRTQLMGLEREHREAKRPVEKSGEPGGGSTEEEEDIGAEKARGLIEKLLAEFEGK